MVIMVSSKLKADSLFCHIRKQWVAALPEEHVRQRLIQHLINDLGFPRGGIAVEMPLVQMPHLQGRGLVVPDRRADIVCFSTDNNVRGTLVPLLMVECKAVPLTSKVLQQVTGYNHFVQATFIAVANAEELRTGWVDAATGEYQFVPFIPAYTALIDSCRG